MRRISVSIARAAAALAAAIALAACERPEPPPPPPPPPAILGFEGAPSAPAVLRQDLRDGAEAIQWHLRSGIAASRPTPDGLELASEGPDPFVSREIRVPTGGVEQVEIETARPIAGSFRVYLAVGGVESEELAADAVPVAPGSTLQIADFRGLPTPSGPVDRVRLDPPPDAGTWTLSEVRVRPRAREGLLNLAGEARFCRTDTGVRIATRALGRDRLLVSLGVDDAPGLDARAAPRRLAVALRSADGATAHRSVHRVPPSPGWHSVWVDLDVADPPRDLTLDLAFTDAKDEPLRACFAAPRLLPRRSEVAARPNVLLVSLDTLRADHLEHAPYLERLGRLGRWFPNSWASSNFTLRSHASLLTGVSPLRLDTPATGLEAPFIGSRLPDRFPTLAELLRDAGYATAATTDGGWMTPTYGFERGFERFHVPPVAATAGEAHVAFARDVAAQSPAPFFLFVHTFVAHDYFLNTPAYHDFVDPVLDEAQIARGNVLPDIFATTAPPAFTRRLYRAGVLRADELLERIVNEVRLASGDAPLLVVVTSDHGESFGDHTGVWHHGTSLLDEQIRVPLVAWENAPGAALGAVAAPTSAIDVAPSLLRRLGVAPPPDLPGETDRFAATPPSPARRASILATFQPFAPLGGLHYAVLDGAWKYLRQDRSDGASLGEHCFDLHADAAEQTSRIDVRPPECLALRADASRRIASETPRSLLVRSNAPIDLSLARPADLVAVRGAHPSIDAIADLAAGRVRWTPVEPDDVLVIGVRGDAPAIAALEVGGVAAIPPGETRGVGDEPQRFDVSRPERGPAHATVAARELDPLAAAHEWTADPAVLEQLRALGYLDEDGAPAGVAR